MDWHDLTDDDLATEGEVMGKGRLVKARFPRLDPPNLLWFWVPVGNCLACRYYQPATATSPPACLEPTVGSEEFAGYQQNAECPVFAPGTSQVALNENPNQQLTQDAMAAAHVVTDQMPSQPVIIEQSVAWSPAASRAAHAQQRAIEQLATAADAGNLDPEDVAYTDKLGAVPGEAAPWTPPVVKGEVKDALRDWREVALAGLASGQGGGGVPPELAKAVPPAIRRWIAGELGQLGAVSGPDRATAVGGVFAKALRMVEEVAGWGATSSGPGTGASG